MPQPPPGPQSWTGGTYEAHPSPTPALPTARLQLGQVPAVEPQQPGAPAIRLRSSPVLRCPSGHRRPTGEGHNSWACLRNNCPSSQSMAIRADPQLCRHS